MSTNDSKFCTCLKSEPLGEKSSVPSWQYVGSISYMRSDIAVQVEFLNVKSCVDFSNKKIQGTGA